MTFEESANQLDTSGGQSVSVTGKDQLGGEIGKKCLEGALNDNEF